MPGFTRIGQLALTVRQLPAALPFYRDVLGLPLLFQARGMAFFQVGELRLMLAEGEPGRAGYSSILYFATDDIEADYRRLKEAGVQFLGEPAIEHRAPDHELWLAFFTDPDGNTHALMEERAVEAA